MHILVANLSPGAAEVFTTLHFPLGLGCVAAALKGAGQQFTVYDSYVDGTTEGFLKAVRRDNPDVILLSGFLGNYTYSFIKDISGIIKEIDRSIVIVIGGPIATTIPELLISKTEVDFVVKGEGECTLAELIDALKSKADISSVSGVYFRDRFGRAAFTGDRQRIERLDDHPFPDYDSFPVGHYVKYLEETGRCWEISASRGCYNRCRFCRLTFGRRVTSYSARAVIDHMSYVLERYKIDRFNFVDDNFLSDTGKIDEFIRLLSRQEHRFKWRFQGRADRISPELVEGMAGVGLFGISFGIESGSQEMLDRYGKNLDIQKVLVNLAAIKDTIKVNATFIVGGPGENWQTIRQTEEFIKRIKLKNIGVGILTLFPGTALYDDALRSGHIDNEEEYCKNLGPVYKVPYINMSDLSDSDLLKARDMLSQSAQ